MNENMIEVVREGMIVSCCTTKASGICILSSF